MFEPCTQPQKSSSSSVRLELSYVGVNPGEPALSLVRESALQLLSAHSGEVDLAVVHVERQPSGLCGCSARLFGKGLVHVGAFAEHASATKAVELGVKRALLAMNTDDLHNPWTSSPPSSQRGTARTK